MIRARRVLRRGAALSLGILCLGVTSSFAETSESAYIYAGRGTLGKVSRWEAWLEGEKGNQASPAGVCLSVDAVGPPVGGLVTESELRECGTVTRRSPLMLVVTAKGDDGNPHTIVAIAAEADMSKVSFGVGSRGQRALPLKRMSKADAMRLGIRRVAYAARAFAGRLCIEGVALHGGGRAFPLRGESRSCR